jgi:ATP-dependent Clp protease ATP-binding subunit ClpA
MRRIVFWIMPVMFVPALWGQDAPKDKKTETPAEQYQALIDELGKSGPKLKKAYSEAATEEEKDKIEKEFNSMLQKLVRRLLELAEKNPKDKVASEALSFAVINAREGSDADKAVQLMLKNHIDKVAEQLPELSEASSPAVEKLIRGFLEKSTDPKDKGQATFTLAKYFKNRSESSDLKPGEQEKLSQQAEHFFAEVVDKYGKVDSLADAIKEAKDGLAELRIFGIGKVAPDIEGEDIDGKKFKLSDYRGKVVVIDFWGNW